MNNTNDIQAEKIDNAPMVCLSGLHLGKNKKTRKANQATCKLNIHLDQGQAVYQKLQLICLGA